MSTRLVRKTSINKILPYSRSTNDKDSGHNSDEVSREAKREEIKKSMTERKIKRFNDILC